jgi:hypothetical protein
MRMQCSKCRYGHGGKGDENVEKEQPVPALFETTCSLLCGDFQAKFNDKNLLFFFFHHQNNIPIVRYLI